MVLEVCVDSIISAVNASEGGADRVELCSALSEGGLTPSLGLFVGVKRALQNSKTKIFCMIRIRRGDFNYSDEEIEAMVEDVKYFKSNGADGIVFGCLDEENKIHVEKNRKILSAWASGSSVTFHRAFDETSKDDIESNIDIIADLGFDRILSSGLEPSAELGIKNLRRMIDHSKNLNIKIMPGAGITSKNIAKIISETGCEEFHASVRSPLFSRSVGKLSMGGGGETEDSLLVCDREKVRELIKISQES